ncbi:LamG-like jellyroll fold domain-containing protein [Polymorphospora rubra]
MAGLDWAAGRLPRRVGVGTLVLALAVTLGPPAPAAASPADRGTGAGGPSTPAATGGAVTERAALRTAAATGQRVEVTGLRTETEEVYALPTGTLLMRQHAQPVRVQRAEGWVPVDTSLRRRADGTVAPVAVPVDVSFSGGGQAPMVTLRRGGGSVALSWPGSLPEPVLDGAVATYPDVLPGVDLRLTASVTGFSEVLVVRTPQAARAPELADLRFAVRGDGLEVRTDRGGNVQVVDARGAVVFHGPTPTMWDSGRGADGAARHGGPATVPADTVQADTGPLADATEGGTRPGPGARVATMAARVTGGALAITPDRALLTDPDTRYPVYIDPYLSYAGTRAAWTHVSKVFSTTSYFNDSGTAKVGYYNDPYAYPTVDTYRAFFRMNTAALAGKTIEKATFNAFQTHAYSCTKREVQLWLTGAISTATTWKNQPAWTRKLDAVTAAKGWSASCPAGGVDLDATSAVREAAEKRSATVTLGLRAASESDTNGWKRFRNNPVLEVEYNSVPSVPTGLKTHPAYACVNTAADAPRVASLTPTFLATLVDPDSALQNVRGRFELYDGDTLLWEHVTTFRQAGAVQATAPTLTDGGAYRWRVRTEDGLADSAWSGFCHIVVDATAPSAVPTVTSTDYPPADPTAPVLAGGVGRPGTFTFAPNGATNVGAYRYAVDDPDPQSSVAATGAGATATVLVTPGPAESWLRTLYVRAVSVAGVPGAVTAYDFYVAPAAAPVAAWSFDEGGGTTAAGGAHPATLGGTAGWTTGRLADTYTVDGEPVADRTLSLDGGGFAATSGPVLDTGTSFTVSAWVRLDSTAANATALTQRGTNAGGFQLYYSTAHGWVFNRHGSDVTAPTIVRAVSDRPARVNRWTHLVGVYDRSAQQIRLYVDGALAGQAAYTTPWQATGPLQFGRLWYDAAYREHWRGGLDDVRAWQRVVYPDEVAGLANRPAALAADWAMDEGTGTSVADVSGRNKTLTLHGGAAWTADHTGEPGTALALNGTTGYAATAVSVVRTDGSFSLSARVRLTADRQAVVLCQEGGRACAMTLYWSSSLSRWVFNMTGADSDAPTYLRAMAPAATPPAEVLNRWFHLVGVYDAAAGQVRLYVDGELVGSAAHPTAWHASGPLHVGRSKLRGAYGEHFAGDVTDVRVFTGVLTQADVDQLRHQ